MLYAVHSIRLALCAADDAYRRSLNLTDRFAHGVGKFGEYIGAKMDAIEWDLAEVKLPPPRNFTSSEFVQCGLICKSHLVLNSLNIALCPARILASSLDFRQSSSI